MAPLAPLLDRIGWTPGELAGRLGCSHAYARQLRDGTREPSPDVTAWLERLAAAHDAMPPPPDWRRPRFGRTA